MNEMKAKRSDAITKGPANPVGAILSGAMLFGHSLGAEHVALSIENAVNDALSKGAGLRIWAAKTGVNLLRRRSAG